MSAPGLACSDACELVRVLVVDGAFRGWRELRLHDHAAYERGLALTARVLAELVASAQLAPPLDATAALLGMVVAGLPGRVVTGPLAVDLITDTVEVDGRRVLVAPREWELLSYLARRLGETVVYEDLIAWIWPATRLHAGRAASLQPSRSSVRMVLGRLRHHLGEAGGLIVTVDGVGVVLHAVPPTTEVR